LRGSDDHEQFHVQKGTYEYLVMTQAKFAQNELAIRHDPELQAQWARIKAAFDVTAYREHKGVIRRSMDTERNLRPSFSVNTRRRDDAFQAAFDAFCLRWNLYGCGTIPPLALSLRDHHPIWHDDPYPLLLVLHPSGTSDGKPLQGSTARGFAVARAPLSPKAVLSG